MGYSRKKIHTPLTDGKLEILLGGGLMARESRREGGSSSLENPVRGRGQKCLPSVRGFVTQYKWKFQRKRNSPKKKRNNVTKKNFSELVSSYSSEHSF